jgi:anaerobic magnesium-protoporphyrin IX monomethyl ester cyclase
MNDTLLINPHRLIPKELSLTQVHSPPLGLAYIAAICIEQGYNVETYDAIAEAPDNYNIFENFKDILVHGANFNHFFDTYKNRNFKIIGLTLMFTNNWLINKKLINEIRIFFPDSIIIAGGEHVSALPEFCLQDCDGLDLIVVGEGEKTMSEICKTINENKDYSSIEGTYFKNRFTNKIVNNSRRKREIKIESFPIPAWHVFPLEKYFSSNASYGVTTERSLPIFATRGCPYSCTFCSSPQMWGTKYIMREYDEVINEIIHLHKNYGVINFDFYDLTAIIKKEWIINFCNAILEKNLKISFQMPAGTRAESIDFEVANLLYKSGCKYITYAPESGSVRILKLIKKKVKLDNMLKSISYSHKVGISIKLNMIIAFPDEKFSDIIDTWKFLIKCSYYGVEDTAPAFFSPYPGSEIYNDLIDKGKIKLNNEYFANIVKSESNTSFTNYNNHISKRNLILISYLSYLIFYTSNFIFRPMRLFKLISSLINGKFYSRGSYVLLKIIKRQNIIK